MPDSLIPSAPTASTLPVDPSWTHFLFTPSAAMLRVSAIVVAAAVAWPAVRWAIRRILARHWSEHHVEVAQQLAFYAVWGSATLLTLYSLGIDIVTLSTSPGARSLVRLGFIALMASVLAPLARRGVVAAVGQRLSAQQAVLSRRAVTYLVWGLAFTTALSELGYPLGFLLGTAGFAGIALTYSGQTSLSNIITGLFLIAEQPFVIGDTITVAGVTGEVLSIDLLSVKLRTADNTFVRIPNESVLRGTVTNMSHYPIRRLDIPVSVGYRESIEKVQRVLFEVASHNPLGLEDPKPIFMLVGYGDSGIDVQFAVWGRKESFLELKNSMYDGIKRAFDRHGIEIPYPHRAMVSGAGQGAVPVRVLPAEGSTQTAPGAALAPPARAEEETPLEPDQLRS